MATAIRGKTENEDTLARGFCGSSPGLTFHSAASSKLGPAYVSLNNDAPLLIAQEEGAGLSIDCPISSSRAGPPGW